MPKYVVSFSRTQGRIYAVEAEKEDTAINMAWDKLRADNEPNKDSQSDWRLTCTKSNALPESDTYFIHHDVSIEALRWILSELCKKDVPEGAARLFMADALVSCVEEYVVSMDSVRSVNTHFSLSRATALAKLSGYERLVLGLE